MILPDMKQEGRDLLNVRVEEFAAEEVFIGHSQHVTQIILSSLCTWHVLCNLNHSVLRVLESFDFLH